MRAEERRLGEGGPRQLAQLAHKGTAMSLQTGAPGEPRFPLDCLLEGPNIQMWDASMHPKDPVSVLLRVHSKSLWHLLQGHWPG